jgi:tight adherence protein B
MANSARDRSELHGHVRAVSAASRLSVIGLTVGTVVAIGALASIRPQYLEPFVQHELGPTLIAAAVVLQVVGIIWVWRVLKVQF